MGDITINLEELHLEESVFKDVKYYVSGHVPEKILEIFRLGGAERMNYFSDYVTHLVCGSDPDENDLADANDVYEIPIVTPRWVITCAKLHKCITPKGFKYDTNQLFSGLTFTFSHIREDKHNLWALITYNGGSVQHNLNSNTTHLLTFDVKTQKYLKAFSLNSIKIVTPDFVIESVKAKQLVQHDLFHPKLLTWPKPRESTALITGFEQDDTEKCSDIPETESTQALLDQLKQRMPWNQPNTPKTATPPSTTYQSFLTPTPAETTAPKPWAPPTPTPSTAPSSQFNFNSQPEPPTTPKRVQWNNQTTSTAFPITPNPQNETPPVKSYPQPLPELVEQPQQTTQQPPPQLQQTTQPLQTTQQQFLQRVQRQQLLNQGANNQFNNNQIQQPLTTQIGNRTFIAATQQPHLVTAQNQQPQQYKLQIAQSHLTTQQPTPTQQQPQQIGLIRQQQPQQIMHQTSQPMLQPQNRLQAEQQLPFNTTQQVTQQFPLQQPQQTVVNQQFGPRAQLQQDQIPFSNQNQQIQMNQQPQQIYNQQAAQQFIQQKVQQRPMHPNWQAQQIVQQQQLNQQQLQLNPQLSQQQLQQQQLTQQQLNPGQINQQLQQRQINQQQLNQEQQVAQQINPQLNQQQLQLTQQQLNQQQLQQRQLNQQQLNQEQQLNPGQTNQQINPGQINQQQLTPQQIGQQLNQQLNQQQLQQQQAQRQIAQQQQINQVQLNQQQLQQPQINQPQQITQQLQLQQLNQQQQQIQLTPQQLQQRQALAQQQLAGQQINQTHLVQQQQLLQQQQQIQRPIGAPRLNWSPNQPQGTMPQRQLIHLDAQTHQQLQQMNTQQRAIFVAKIQKQRQIMLQQRHLLQQQQQRGGHLAVIRGGTPPQPQIQWLQQQQQNVAKQQTIVMPQHAAPGLSPIAQGGQIMNDQQSQQIQIQRQQFQRLQQLQMQREQAQKQQLAQQVPTVAIVRPPLTPQEAPSTVVAVQGSVVDPAAPATPQQQLVNAKTKTALANMLSIRLQSGGGNITPVDGEPSAAGTLRLMTAQHNAALNQTAARPQELIAIQQQRRTLGNITNATSDLPRAPPPTPAPAGATPQSETKPQFSPGRVLAPPQHRHGPFYGHNPNLKLPPELFLLGCIFVVVEVERYLEETSPDWRQVIEKHGGEIEPVYCSRVTHVLCETQRHGVVMQALRDFKRCVTLFWLDDVVQRKQVVPPWQALHLPTGYIDGAPAAKHLISLSGFTGNDRNKVREMITYTGAKFTKYFSRHNTVLVCAKSEGVKHQHAKKWNTPIVNVQWLTDLMLGNFSALNQIEHVKYQQFTQPTQFGFDTALVPNLMFAWKMPINISQESYERVKRSASPVVGPQKAKKPRVEPQSVIEDEKPPRETSPTHRILFSTHEEKDRVSLEKIVIQLGGSIANSHEDATHLVMSRLSRTTKLLFGIVVGAHILPDKWLKDSEESQKFLPESEFQFDTKDFNTTFFCDFYATIALKKPDKLFANKVFYLTPSVFPSYSILKELIERCGGLVEKTRRSLQQIEAANATVPYSYVILTAENDLHLVYDCLRNIKGDKRCVSNTEVVMDAILNQKIANDKYLVKVY